MNGKISILVFLPLMVSCWYQNFAIAQPDIPSQAPPQATIDPKTPGGLTLAGRNAAGNQFSDPSYLPPQAVTLDLPGGVRAITRTLFDKAPFSAAYLKLSLPSRGPDLYGLPLLLAETVVSARRSGSNDSLRTAIRRLGGQVLVAADHLTTSFLITVPQERWHDALRRLAATMHSAQIDRGTVEAVKRYQLNSLRATYVNRPAQAMVDRLIDHRELGAEARYAALQDLDVSDVTAAYGTGYSSQNAILNMVVPDLDANTQLRQLKIILAPWTGREISERSALETPPLARGIFWDPSSSDRSTLVVMLELPRTDGQTAAAKLIAIQALTADGVGGRLGHTLGQLFPHEIGFAAHRVEQGERQYLQLSTHSASSQVTAIIAAFLRAARSLSTKPPSAQELSTAANRAIMHLLQDERAPRAWLDSSTRRSLEALELDTTVGQTLAALEHPTTLALDNAFTTLAEAVPTWIVLGGKPPTSDDSISIIEDNRLQRKPALVREASQTLQETLAAQILFKVTDALGGRDRILAISGYAAESRTTSTTGLQFDDREWFDVTGRLHRTRKILGTTVDTLMNGDSADERVGEESRPLSEQASQNLLVSFQRHPLLLIRAFLLGLDRYRLVSVRDSGDRRMAVLELIDPTRPRLRLQVDQESGLLRSVERIVALDGLPPTRTLDLYRDYRSVSGLRIPFHRSTSHDLPGSGSETQWQKFELGEQEDSVFQRKL